MARTVSSDRGRGHWEEKRGMEGGWVLEVSLCRVEIDQLERFIDLVAHVRMGLHKLSRPEIHCCLSQSL